MATLLLLLLLLAPGLLAVAGVVDVDISSFGCKPGGAVCTAAFQTAMKQVSSGGGGTIHVRGPGAVVTAGIEMLSDVTLQVHLERDSRTTGWAEVSINGKASGRGEIPFYMRMVSSIGSSVGMDHGSAVSARYQAPFEFAGTLHHVEIQLPARRDAAETAATAASEMSRQ